ncbi:MAG: aldo/keto reductase [Kiritimatiellia bacterium]
MPDLTSTVKLNDGNRIPRIGLGIFQIKDPAECEKAVTAALDTGYRHIDTAAAYGNEEFAGKAIRESGISREDIFVTTKVFVSDFGREKTRRACEASLKRLGMDYVDLYLIHWPVRGVIAGTWEVMQKMRDEGKLRSIGVSNFTVRRFEEQFFKDTGEVPAVNQIEIHPFNTRADLLKYCRGKGIQPEAYSPLARAQRMDDELLNRIARKYGRSAAQVMIRWQIQQDIVVIPKSVNPERIRENSAVFDFELSEEDMNAISGLNEDLYTISWRPEENWF